ncbi:hypothetical protein L3Q82_009201 [Scortum barcoo]|uniref:Uncharacterized protein n=1 Tax=Scortum barcoo TaxID=214431 RepID=A0ACB8WFX2_9TELE|nr:hypothetical protein L3Q82_009201 [Scortum barcoo]
MSLGWPGNIRLGVPPEELEEVSGVREVWASLLRLLPLRPAPDKADEDGWMDGWMRLQPGGCGSLPTGTRPGSARNGDVGPPSSRLTTRRKVHEGPPCNVVW